MKKISYWAKNHVWQSRVLIVIMYFLLNIIGIYTGKLLTEINVVLPNIYFISCIILTIALWIYYPQKQNAKSSFSSSMYVRRKLFDFCLATVTFLMIVYAGNNWKYLFIKSETAQAAKVTPISKNDSVMENNPLMKNFVAALKGMDAGKLSAREKARIIKHQVKLIQHDKNSTGAEKGLLIALSVIVALLLLVGVAGLSCSIGCAGSEALAVVVALLGTFLVIFLLVKVIHSISHPKMKTKEDMQK